MCIKKIKSWFKKKSQPSTDIAPLSPRSINIEEFVKSSVVGIMSGIRGAQKEYQEANSAYAPLICPAWGPALSDIAGVYCHQFLQHKFAFNFLKQSLSLASSSRAV